MRKKDVERTIAEWKAKPDWSGTADSSNPVGAVELTADEMEQIAAGTTTGPTYTMLVCPVTTDGTNGCTMYTRDNGPDCIA